MRSLRGVAALSLIAAAAVAVSPAFSERIAKAPAPIPTVDPDHEPAAQPPVLQNPNARPVAKSFPVTVPEAKAAAAAKTKPPEVWPAAEIASAKARCTAIMKRIHAAAIPEPPIKQGICGTPAPIQLISIGKNPEVALSPPVTVTCEMAEALYTWMKTEVQPQARKQLGADVIKIETMSSYSCRNAYGRKGGRLSEHGVANAIDIRGFVTSAGRQAFVLDHWGTTQREILARVAAEKAKAARLAAEKIVAERAAAQKTANAEATEAPPLPDANQAPAPPVLSLQPAVIDDGSTRGESESPAFTLRISPSRLGGPKPESGRPSDEARRRLFLHGVHASACRTFGTTLGPEANNAHKNHFHFDMAARRNGLKICD